MFPRFLICAAATLLLAVSASAQTADDLIAKNIQAHGGMDKIKSVNTMRFTGKIIVGPGIEAPIVAEFKRPNNMRFEITVQGLSAVQAYNGKTGWEINPFNGKKDPEPMGEDDLKDVMEQADFDGPLVDYKQKGNKVEYAGKEPVEGTDAYKLKVTLKSGDVRYLYLDTDSYLEIREVSKRTIRGTEREIESNLGDYKPEGGVMMAHSIEEGAKGSAEKQKITIEKVEINPPIEDSRFAMPGGEKKAAPNQGEKAPEDKKPEVTKPAEPAKPPAAKS